MFKFDFFRSDQSEQTWSFLTLGVYQLIGSSFISCLLYVYLYKSLCFLTAHHFFACARVIASQKVGTGH